MNIHSYPCGYPRCVSRVTIVVFHCGFASFKEVLVKFVSFDLACTSKSVESVAVPASFKTPRMSHRATSVPSEAHVWIVGFSILMDGRSMGGVQHRWIEERLEEKGTALMASNAHAAPLHFVHPETASVFFWPWLMSIWGYAVLVGSMKILAISIHAGTSNTLHP